MDYRRVWHKGRTYFLPLTFCKEKGCSLG